MFSRKSFSLWGLCRNRS